jgi:hypothetical protein
MPIALIALERTSPSGSNAFPFCAYLEKSKKKVKKHYLLFHNIDNFRLKSFAASSPTADKVCFKNLVVGLIAEYLF